MKEEVKEEEHEKRIKSFCVGYVRGIFASANVVRSGDK